MQASVGDKLHVHGRVVGQGDRVVEIVEVRGAQGGPPYLVRDGNGQETLVFPGPDAVIKHPQTSTHP